MTDCLGLSSRWFHHVEWIVFFLASRQGGPGLIYLYIYIRKTEYVQGIYKSLKLKRKAGVSVACVVPVL